jgi:hypothetical protein
VGDVYRSACGLALVIELRKELQHRCPHHLSDRMEIGIRRVAQDSAPIYS